MAGANPAVGETSGTAGVTVRNVPISCSLRLLLVHQAVGCTGSLEVRAAPALCSPVSLGTAVRLLSLREGFPSSGYCFSVSALRLLIPVYLLKEVILLGGVATWRWIVVAITSSQKASLVEKLLGWAHR